MHYLFAKPLLSPYLVLNKLRVSLLVSGLLHLPMLFSLSGIHHPGQHHFSSRSFAGCRCGMQIHMGHIIIRSGLVSCSTSPAIIFRLPLPDPLESLIVQIPPLDDLALYTPKAEAGVTLLKAVRKKLKSRSRFRQVDQLVEIARTFAQDMKLLKPSLNRKFNHYISLKVSFTSTVIVFIVSTVLHLVFLYVYHRNNPRDGIFPKSSMKTNAIKCTNDSY